MHSPFTIPYLYTMDQETYDNVVSLFSAHGFSIKEYGLGCRGYINLGDMSWIEFIGFRATPEILVEMCIDGKMLEEIVITELGQAEFIVEQFKLNENTSIQYDKNQT